MKLAILSDIHGNAAALEAALAGAKREGAEHLLLAGDYVGYYFEPSLVLELLDEWPKTMVQGNHDAMLSSVRAGTLSPEIPRNLYGPGLDIALQNLSLSQLDQIDALQHPLRLSFAGRDILLCHGAPKNRDQYVYPDAGPEIISQCGLEAIDLVVLGHTHIAMTLATEGAIVHNPGSVGQPRNRKPGSHWSLYETNQGSLTQFIESYNIDALRVQCDKLCPAIPFLSDVLVRT